MLRNQLDRGLSAASWFRPISPTLWLIVVGVLLRIAWLAVFDIEPVSDTKVYLERAQSIATGKGYSYPDGSPTAYLPVGYPAFLAVSLYLANGAVVFGKLVNIGLFVVSCILVTAIGKQTQLDWGGKTVVAFLALSPNQIAYANLFTSEPLSLCLLLGFLLFYIEAHKEKNYSWSYVVASALFFAAAYYVKPQVLFIPVGIFLIILAFRREAQKRSMAINTVVYTVLILAVLPWVARNYYHFNQFIPIATNGGINLYIGNNPYAIGTYRWDDSVTKPLQGRSEYARDREASRLAMEHIRRNPVEAIKLAPAKMWFLLKTDSEGIAWNEGGLAATRYAKESPMFAFKVMSQLMYIGLLITSVIGLVWAAERASRFDFWTFVPALIVLYFFAVYAVFFGATRFHYVFLPFLFLYSGVAVEHWLSGGWRRHTRSILAIGDAVQFLR